jgi:hypothetical protein
MEETDAGLDWEWGSCPHDPEDRVRLIYGDNRTDFTHLTRGDLEKMLATRPTYRETET